MSEGNKEPRVLFRVVVNQEILEDFKSAIVDEHGKLWGNVELETNLALKERTERLRGGGR